MDGSPFAQRESRTGPFWVLAAVGVALLGLAALVDFFVNVGDLDGDEVTPALLAVLGGVLASVALAAASLQRGLALGVRTALLLGAGYLAFQLPGLSFFSGLQSIF